MALADLEDLRAVDRLVAGGGEAAEEALDHLLGLDRGCVAIEALLWGCGVLCYCKGGGLVVRV